MADIRRLGFKPWVEGLDDKLEGGVPEGSWLLVYGPPGAYKTLHALAFCLNALVNKEKCIYISTESDYHQLMNQLSSLGWRAEKVNSTLFTTKILKSKDYGYYDLVWIDLDALRFWAWKLNQVVREERSGSTKKKWYWYNDPVLLTHAIIVALGAVGVLERKAQEITINEIERSRLKDGLKKDSEYATFRVNRDVSARVIVDSLGPYIRGRYSIAGNILTDMKVRLMLPNVTYMLIDHPSKSTEEELGAGVGHVADGIIKLWREMRKDEGITKYYGWIVKMRVTDHSRSLHTISLTSDGDIKKVVWSS